MRWWAPFVLLPSLACEPEPVLDCVCVSPGFPRETLDGAFVHTLERVEVRSGDYAPPALPPPTTALALSSEHFMVWQLGAGDAVVVRTEWLDARTAPGANSCCPGWEGLSFTSPQPRWNERNRARPDASSELGTIVARLDPTLVRAEPVPFDAALDEGDATLPFEPDPDGRGFVLRADYLVTPAGCSDPSCAAVIRLTHHLRRPD